MRMLNRIGAHFTASTRADGPAEGSLPWSGCASGAGRRRPNQQRLSDARGTSSPPRAAAALGAAAALTILLGAPQPVEAQEILLTGPLAGAGSVRKLRLYRKARFEFAPTASFTLLDEYLRQAILGARLSYNITDSFAIGVWGGISPSFAQSPAGLVERIQQQSQIRANENAANRAQNEQPSIYNRLTSLNVGQDFEQQLGSIEWIAAPQLKLVPFRGKIALFQSLYVDSDLYFFGGPAIVGVSERAECAGTGSLSTGGCSSEALSQDLDAEGQPIAVPSAVSFTKEDRITIAPTFGLGFTFYLSSWASFGFEWRATPFRRNTGGFDNHGSGPDDAFPDNNVDGDDRDLKLNQMLSISFGISLPVDYQVSE